MSHEKPHVCPYWIGYLLASPIRKLFQDPRKLLAPFVTEGMVVVEPGPGMGFFTLELARLVGPSGKVVAIDVQQKMLAKLAQRARKANLDSRIILREPNGESMKLEDLTGQVDFILAAAIVHELPNVALFFKEMHRALKPHAPLLLLEPSGHVKPTAWQATLQTAVASGFQKRADLRVRRFHTTVLVRP